MNIQIKTSVGDFLDRWSILLIKEQKGLDVEKELSDYTKNLKPDFQDWGYYLRILEAINGDQTLSTILDPLASRIHSAYGLIAHPQCVRMMR